MHNKRTPYDMIIHNHLKIEDDKTCNSNYEYMMKYYKEIFSDMFKIWFEDKYEKAWLIFEEALKATNEVSKSQELMINNRNFFIVYSSDSVGFTVSLKLK